MVNSNGISFSGLASGLDTSAIIRQLVALERIPIQLVEVKKAGEQDKLDKVDALADLVKALQTKAESLSTSSKLLAFSVSNYDSSVAELSTTGFATGGTHTLEVLALAEADRWAFDEVVDPDAALAGADGQTVSFTVAGTDYSVAVDQSSSSLRQIAGAIEDEAGDAVTATVVNTGTDADPSYRLLLAARETGEDNRISGIASTIDGLSIDYSPPDAGGDPTSEDNLTVGTNAQAIVDGLEVERTSNDFSDVLKGIEITVLGVNAGDPMTFSVDPDKDVVRAGLEDFVETYNDVIRFVNQQSTYTPPEDGEDGPGEAGVLFGDVLLRRIQETLQRAMFDVDVQDVIDDTEGYSTLSLVGIDVEDDGTLQIDGERLEEKMLANIELFADLFTDDDGFDNGDAEPNTPGYFADTTADSGLFASLGRELDRMFGTFEGPIDDDTGDRMVLDSLFDLRRDTLRASIRDLDDRVEIMEDRLDTFEATLVRRFTRLEELMGALNAQGAALNNLFAGQQQ